jgi:heme oxygenase (biliverdin-IX-beta and delta-forming)
MVTDRLKQETLPLHQQLEKWLVHRIKSMQSIDQYTSLLQSFYGFYQPLERNMLPLVESVIPDLAERRKSELLQQDIDTLQPGQTNIPLSTRLPIITNTAAALGAMYVFEGSTLGGSIIAKMVKGKIDRLPGNALQFFQGYGPQTMEKWERFKQYTNEFITTEDQRTALIKGANDTFSLFYQWLKSNQTDKTNE